MKNISCFYRLCRPLARLFLLFFVACTQPARPPVPVRIFLSGHFFTANPDQPTATALAVAGDTILAIGTDTDIRALAGQQTEIIDLQGAFAMPGLIEGHGHFNGLGNSLQTLNLLNTKSWEEIVGLVAEQAKKTPPGNWIEGRGWHQEKWLASTALTVNGYPYNDLLSAAVPDHPVILQHASGHGLIANAKALDMAGISKETSDPAGGRVVRDVRGKLTGVFEENATMMIERPFEAWKAMKGRAVRRSDFEKSAQLAAQECLRHGITSFQDAGCGFWELEEYRRLAESGQLGVRLWTMVSQPHPSELSRLANYPAIGLGNGFFTCRAVKCYMDGALGSYGAWLLAPYNDKPGFTGQNVVAADSIAAVAAACRKYGLQCCVHAIGDRGNRETLNIFEQALDTATNLRWRVEHAQHLDAQDIPRFAKMGVIAAMQALHCTSDAPFVVKRLGTERARTGAYAWRSLLDSGAHLANGTDAPVEDVAPMPCLYASVTRQRADNGMVFFPEQCMTREEALRSYTTWNAWAGFEENKKGKLKPGLYADIAVFDTDLLRCPPADILKAKVKMTILGGVVKYREERGERREERGVSQLFNCVTFVYGVAPSYPIPFLN